MSDQYVERLLAEPVPRELAFGDDEYAERVAKVQSALRDRELDALVIHNVVDICYLAGYQTLWPEAYACLVVPQGGTLTMQTTALEVSCAVLHGTVRDFVVFNWMEGGGAIAQLAELLRERGYRGKRIGVQKGRIELGSRGPVDAVSYEQLRAALSDVDLVDASTLMFELRLRKSEAELEVMRRAAEITSVGIMAAMKCVAPGCLDNDIVRVGAGAMLDAGSEFFSIDPIVTAGHRSGWAHTTWKRFRINVGDHVLLEFGGVFQRYTAPLMRTVVVGSPSDRSRRLADAAIETLHLLEENVKPGRTASEVAKAAAKGLQSLDDSVFRTGMCGYSVGLGFPPTWTDGPMYIGPGNDRVLEPGMTFHAPITLRIPREFTVGFSETIAVTSHGCEVLTHAPRELCVVQG